MTDAETTTEPTTGPQADDGADDPVVVVQHVAAPAETVFDFLVEPEKMLRWMGSAVELDPRPGGKFWLNATGTDIAIGEYVEVDRPNKVVFTWGWEGSDDVPPGSTTVVISLSPADDDATTVELRHFSLPGGRDDEHGRGWTHLFGRLAIAATGGDPDAEQSDEAHGHGH